MHCENSWQKYKTISRKLNRVQADKFQGNYIASTTHEKVQELWRNSHKRQKSILKQRNVRDFVEKYLQYGYSPAIISHLLQERFCEKVSDETLYIYIYSSPKGLKKYLLRRKQGRKSKKKNRFSYIGKEWIKSILMPAIIFGIGLLRQILRMMVNKLQCVGILFLSPNTQLLLAVVGVLKNGTNFLNTGN